MKNNLFDIYVCVKSQVEQVCYCFVVIEICCSGKYFCLLEGFIFMFDVFDFGV